MIDGVTVVCDDGHEAYTLHQFSDPFRSLGEGSGWDADSHPTHKDDQRAAWDARTPGLQFVNGGKRYNLRCKVCGDALAVRYETVAPILDRLAENGIARITLSRLRAIVS